MRVLVVTQYFWPESFRINDLALELHKRGHEVVVLTGMPNYPKGIFFPGYSFFGPRKENYNGITIVRVPLVSRGQKQPWRLALNFFSFAFFASILGPIMCRGHFDIIFTCQLTPVTVGIPAIILKKIKRAPLLFWVQDLWPESLSATGSVSSPWVLRMVNVLVRWIYKHCDRILVQSRGFVESIKAHGGAPDKILYLPNWAEDVYKPIVLEHDAPEQKEMPQGFRVMFAGNIGAAQGFETILDAADILKPYSDIHWVILGEGRMFAWIEQEIQKRGLSQTVHLLGRRPMEAMPRYFSLAHVLLASLKRDPIFALTIPGKVQSYLASARPIIAALDGEGANVVTESRAGISCGSDNPQALAQAVLQLRGLSEDDRENMGKNGRVYFEANFNRATLVSNLEAWMRDLVQGFHK